MEPITPTAAQVMTLPATLIIFLLPGWILARRLGTPSPLLVAFFGSATLLFTLALLFNAVDIPLHAGTVGLGLTVAAVGLAWRMRTPAKTLTPVWRGIAFHRQDLIWLIAPIAAFTSIAVRATIDPLSGYDNGFRWDYLARLFLGNRSLAGYPPISSADFELYAWCDGIPPLVPLLNFWIYASVGSIAPALTALRVVGEAVLLGGVVVRYSKLLWNESAGSAALAAFSSSALVLWSLAMGQETGLTALALVAMLYFLELYVRTPQLSLVFCAALAGVVGALSREYGLAFPVVGFAILCARLPSWKAATLWLGTTLLVIPWYLRNWAITGNPLYPQTLGGVFPGNAVHDEFMRMVGEEWGLRISSHAASSILVFLFLIGGLVVAGVVGIFCAGRRSAPILSGIILVILLWIWSIPQTAGGWVYSMRMLLPACALLAVLAGWMGTRGIVTRSLCALMLTVLSLDAARRSWLLPLSPLESPWSVSFATWSESRVWIKRVTAAPVWNVLRREAKGRGIVVDHPSHHALLTMQGGNAVPIFSPLAAPAFDRHLAFPLAIERLRASGVRFITVTWPTATAEKFLRPYPFWMTLCHELIPNAQIGALAVFDLDQLQPRVNP